MMIVQISVSPGNGLTLKERCVSVSLKRLREGRFSIGVHKHDDGSNLLLLMHYSTAAAAIVTPTATVVKNPTNTFKAFLPCAAFLYPSRYFLLA